jgi:hypothetical protein
MPPTAGCTDAIAPKLRGRGGGQAALRQAAARRRGGRRVAGRRGRGVARARGGCAPGVAQHVVAEALVLSLVRAGQPRARVRRVVRHRQPLHQLHRAAQRLYAGGCRGVRAVRRASAHTAARTPREWGRARFRVLRPAGAVRRGAARHGAARPRVGRAHGEGGGAVAGAHRGDGACVLPLAHVRGRGVRAQQQRDLPARPEVRGPRPRPHVPAPRQAVGNPPAAPAHHWGRRTLQGAAAAPREGGGRGEGCGMGGGGAGGRGRAGTASAPPDWG